MTAPHDPTTAAPSGTPESGIDPEALSHHEPAGHSTAHPGTADRWWALAFWATALVAALVIGYLARYASLWADDWQLIFTRLSWSADSILRPHWGHPVILPSLLWKTVISTIGLTSYVPFLALVLTAHVLVAGAVFFIVRRLAGAPIGYAAGVLMLILGSGAQAFLVPASLNLTGAAAAGLWAVALFLREPGRRGLVAIALLLIVAVCFSGAGLFFVAALGGTILLLPGRRRELLAVLPAAVLFVAWRAVFDRPAGITSAAVSDLVTFVETGVAHAIGAVSGLGDEIGLIAAAVLLLATLWHLLGRRALSVPIVLGVVGMLAVYGITSLARSTAGQSVEQAASPSRYIYLAAPFLLIASAGWLGLRPTDSTWSARRVLPLGAVFALAAWVNLAQIPGFARFVTDQGQTGRAAIVLLQAYAGSPALPLDVTPPNPDGAFMATMPAPRAILDGVAAHGSPADPDPLTPGRPPVPAATLERVLMGWTRGSYVVTPGQPLPTGSTAAPEVRLATDATTADDGSCLVATPSGAAPSVVVAVPSGGSLAITGTDGAALGVSLSADGSFSTPDTRQATLASTTAVTVAVPDLDATWPWSVRLDLPAAGGPTRVCGIAAA